MPTYFLWFLFSWRGRITASAYRISMLVLGLLIAALKLGPDELHNLLLGVLGVQLVVQASLDAKRLHDIGWSAVWVPITTIVGITGAGALHVIHPQLLELVAQEVFEMLGPIATKYGPIPTIVICGVAAAAVSRASMLAKPESNKKGDIYDYTPGGARGDSGEDHKSAATAEALIAKALEEKRQRELKAAMAEQAPVRAAPSQRFAAGGARKSFGMRRSA